MGQYNSDINELSHIDGSLCISCEHMISRTIFPMNYEDFGINAEDLTMPDGTETPIVHVVCIKLNMDLDHIVLNCNKYEFFEQTA